MVAVRVQLNDGLQLVTRLTLDEMDEAFRKALDRRTTLAVRDRHGTKRVVNPLQILYFEEIDDATAERLENGAHYRYPAPA
jgi:hypothetical protein